MSGFYLSLDPPIWVNDKGEGFMYTRDGGGGLSDLGDRWDKVFDLVGPISAGFGAWLANKGQPKQPAYYPTAPPGGAYLGGGGGSLFGGIDTTTLLLIGGAVLLFMSKPGR